MQGLGPARRILVKPQVHMGFVGFVLQRSPGTMRNHVTNCSTWKNAVVCPPGLGPRFMA